VQSLLGGEKGEFLDHIMLSYSIMTLNLYVMVFHFISKFSIKMFADCLAFFLTFFCVPPSVKARNLLVHNG
jgi:hypothetical protein